VADFIFNVDFEDPPHVVDQQVVTGSAFNLPTGADPTVMVRTNIGDFSTQVASLEPAGAMGFFYAPSVTSGAVRLSWDMAVISLGTGGGLDTAAIAIQSSPEGIGDVFIDYEYDYDLEIAGVDVGTYTLGQQDHLEFFFDLDSDSYNVWLNSALVLSNQALNPTFDIQNVLFSRENLQNPSYAVDNFQWEIIPEPSTMVLLVVGAAGLIISRRQRA
jgi:hypothetical protein